MANGQYVGVNGVARKVTSPYIGVDGVARNVKSGYVGVNGVARLFFAPDSGNVVLEVEKITSDTYANDTTYTAEEFILLDIYPKTGGTVNVTYGGLTKTITDTSGAAEPNAQQVFFGTFNGVSDNVATPSSGTLTIEGECVAVGCSMFNVSSKNSTPYNCVTAIISFGNTSKIPERAYGGYIGAGCPITSVNIPENIKEIDENAFVSCRALESIVIENGVESIGDAAFRDTALTEVLIPASVNSINGNPFRALRSNIVAVDSGNRFYKIDGNGLIEIATNKLISGFVNTVIPSYVTEIGRNAFVEQTELTSVTIPEQITRIGAYAYWITGLTKVSVLATTPPTIGENVFSSSTEYVVEIIVPKGCLSAYQSADGWSKYTNNPSFTMKEAS